MTDDDLDPDFATQLTDYALDNREAETEPLSVLRVEAHEGFK